MRPERRLCQTHYIAHRSSSCRTCSPYIRPYPQRQHGIGSLSPNYAEAVRVRSRSPVVVHVEVQD